MKGRA